MGPILIPAMEKKGYPRAFAAAVTSSSASLAIIIPPSIPMILYGVMSGSSIVQLFVAGIVPGILGGVGLMIVSYWMARRRSWPVEEVFQLRRVWTTFREAAWAFIIPVIILGSIFGGFVTATEGAGIAVVAALFVGGVIYRELNVSFLYKAAIEGAIQTAVVMLLVAASALLGIYLTEAQVPQRLAQGILDFTENRYAVLALLNIFFFVIGLFLHSAAAIILVVPIVMPLVGSVGIDPVQFRPDRDVESRHRPADPAGGECAHRCLLGRQGGHLGGDEVQCLVRRRSPRRAHARDLCAADTDGARRLLLRMTSPNQEFR
jgi:tripartite ATP-independent transporter DctM subunit